MKPAVIIILLILTAAGGFCSGEAEEPDITVFAAASTADLVDSLSEAFSREYGTGIKLNAASSGTLARQIEQGAEPDLYISASADWMNYVDDLGFISGYQAFMGNSLVLITPLESSMTDFNIIHGMNPPDFDGKLSIADPDHAPAGRYAVEALKSAGWYASIESRLQPGADVRAALSVVEFGEAQLGIVYKTDAVLSSKVRIISVFPENMHTPIKYYCGLLQKAAPAAEDFYRFLTEAPEADSLIRTAGFSR